MSWGWQEILTAAIVLCSATYLMRIARRALARNGGGCGTGGCGSCPGGGTATGHRPSGDGPGQVIPLDALTRPPVRR